jgi:NAD(P)-dependent dehydrogenase (short-subunit alcohol dehydrogenase family)
MTPWSGKWALVTGASAGIGTALAEELAGGGTNLVLTARRRERLEELAQKLAAAHKIQTKVFVADLTQEDAPEKIFQFTKEQGIEIELLINNAGFGAYGEFHTIETRRLTDMVQVNCAAGNGRAAPRLRAYSCVHRVFSKRAVHFDLRRDQSFRPAFCGRLGGRDETLRRASLRSMSRLDGVRILRNCRTSAPGRYDGESRVCRESGANWFACARSGQKLCNFRAGKLSGRARTETCLPAYGGANCSAHVQA